MSAFWRSAVTKRLLRTHKYLLAILDVLSVILAFFSAWYIRYQMQWYRTVDPASYTQFDYYLRISLVASTLILIAFYLEGVYRLPPGTSYLNEFYRLFNGVTTVTIVLMVGNFMFQPLFHSRLVYGIAGVFILLFTTSTRVANRLIMAQLRQRGIGTRRMLLVGAGEVSRKIMRLLLANPSLGFDVAGFLDDNPERGQRDLGPFTALGAIDNLAEVLREKQVDEVIVTLPWQYHRRIMSVLAICERAGVRARVVPDMLQMSLDRVDFEVLKGIPLLGVKHMSLSGPRSAVKRALDLIVAVIGLIITLPIMLLIAIAIKIDSPGPVLFVQERIGKNGQPFKTYKFRSMVLQAEALREHFLPLNEADGPLFKIREDPRATNVGRFLRRFSLDELPQFFNVVRGDMSLVGPRPALPSEVEDYEAWHRKRLEVTPGMTGLWQVSGRSDLSFDEMMLLDIYYVENWSPFVDISIMLRTIPRVLSGEGAY